MANTKTQIKKALQQNKYVPPVDKEKSITTSQTSRDPVNLPRNSDQPQITLQQRFDKLSIPPQEQQTIVNQDRQNPATLQRA